MTLRLSIVDALRRYVLRKQDYIQSFAFRYLNTNAYFFEGGYRCSAFMNSILCSRRVVPYNLKCFPLHFEAEFSRPRGFGGGIL